MESPRNPAGTPGDADKASLKLSPQEFGKVLEALRVSASSGGSDKRRFNRIDVEAKISLASLNNGQVNRIYDGMSRDISINGMGLLQSKLFSRGESFLVCLPLGKEEMIVKCKVTFCRAVAEGIYAVGAEFAAKVDPQVIPRPAKEEKAAEPAPVPQAPATAEPTR